MIAILREEWVKEAEYDGPPVSPADLPPRLDLPDGYVAETYVHVFRVTGESILPQGEAFRAFSFRGFMPLNDGYFAVRYRDKSWHLKSTANPNLDVLLHPNDIEGISISPDGKYLVLNTVSPDDKARAYTTDVYGVENEELQAHLFSFDEPVTSFKFSPNSSLLAYTTQDGSVGVWDLARKRQLWCQTTHSWDWHVTHGTYPDVHFSDFGNALVATDKLGRMSWFDAGTGAELRRLDLGIGDTWVSALGQSRYMVTSGRLEFSRSIIDLPSGPHSILELDTASPATAMTISPTSSPLRRWIREWHSRVLDCSSCRAQRTLPSRTRRPGYRDCVLSE